MYCPLIYFTPSTTEWTHAVRDPVYDDPNGAAAASYDSWRNFEDLLIRTGLRREDLETLGRNMQYVEAMVLGFRLEEIGRNKHEKLSVLSFDREQEEHEADGYGFWARRWQGELWATSDRATWSATCFEAGLNWHDLDWDTRIMFWKDSLYIWRQVRDIPAREDTFAIELSTYWIYVSAAYRVRKEADAAPIWELRDAQGAWQPFSASTQLPSEPLSDDSPENPEQIRATMAGDTLHVTTTRPFNRPPNPVQAEIIDEWQNVLPGLRVRLPPTDQRWSSSLYEYQLWEPNCQDANHVIGSAAGSWGNLDRFSVNTIEPIWEDDPTQPFQWRQSPRMGRDQDHLLEFRRNPKFKPN